MIDRAFGGRALAVLASVALGMVAAPAFALSADAQTIVNRVRADTPDLKPVCSNRAKLTTAVTNATITLATTKKINPDRSTATAAGQEAGRYLYFHCS